jgi:hypothetical protein
VIDRRIKQMLTLWADDGSITLESVTPARVFSGKGELGTASCAPNSNTLCDFFKNVAGSFQPQNRFVSLAPTYKTRYATKGDMATTYFECHYFNVDPTRADRPLWKDVGHFVFDGTAKKVDGQWRFDHADISVANVPRPYSPWGAASAAPQPAHRPCASTPSRQPARTVDAHIRSAYRRRRDWTRVTRHVIIVTF